MVDAVLLEWEGVLADTRAARRDALRLALSAEGVAHALSDDDEQLRGLGVDASVRTILRHIGSSDVALGDLLVARATRAFAERLAQGIVLAPDAAACVEGLQAGARIALVTRAARAETEAFLRMSGMEGAVTMLVCADDVAEDAPTPQAYRHALAQLGRVRRAEAGRSVAIVDAPAPVRAARAAGVMVLSVGAPAHEAIEADAAVQALAGLDLGALFPVAARQRDGGCV